MLNEQIKWDRGTVRLRPGKRSATEKALSTFILVAFVCIVIWSQTPDKQIS